MMAANHTDYCNSFSGTIIVEKKTTARPGEKSKDVQRYRITERGKKTHEQEQSGKGFSQPGRLRTHKKRHSGEKPFECDQCGKCFSLSGNLKKHKRIHSGEKPFQCRQCHKCFRQKGNLEQHERTQRTETF